MLLIASGVRILGGVLLGTHDLYKRESFPLNRWFLIVQEQNKCLVKIPLWVRTFLNLDVIRLEQYLQRRSSKVSTYSSIRQFSKVPKSPSQSVIFVGWPSVCTCIYDMHESVPQLSKAGYAFIWRIGGQRLAILNSSQKESGFGLELVYIVGNQWEIAR